MKLIQVGGHQVLRLEVCIASVDIETFGLSLDCVVDEIGVVVTNFLPIATSEDAPGLEALMRCLAANDGEGVGLVYDSVGLILRPLEQILNGRSFDKGTIAFRRRVFEGHKEHDTDYRHGAAFEDRYEADAVSV